MSEQEQNDRVQYFDFPNKRIIEIPRSELAQGAIQVQIEGVEGLVWVLAGDLQHSAPRHPPFVGERREQVQEIHSTFSEHRDLSYEEWEDGFRRDTNPDSEIKLWLHAAQVYRDATASEPSQTRRKEIHEILIACLTTQPDTVWDVLTLDDLTKNEAQTIIDLYHHT